MPHFWFVACGRNWCRKATTFNTPISIASAAANAKPSLPFGHACVGGRLPSL